MSPSLASEPDREAAHGGWAGCLPALVTPLTPGREVDEGGVRALVRRAVADGASGVLVAGSTGEGTLLTAEQRRRVTRSARAALAARGEAADGGAGQGEAGPVLLAGASGSTVGDLEEDVVRLGDAGADAVLVLAPHTYPLRPEELVDLHVGIAEGARLPTLVYHIPQLTGSTLTAEAVQELAAHPRIVGMKDSSPDPDRRAELLAAAPGPGFDVLTGHAPTLQRALEEGASGSITAVANLRQRRVVALHEAVAAGQRDRAGELQRSLTRHWEGITAAGASVPAVLKAALQLDGIIEERWCRPPLRSLDTRRLDRVRTALMG